ncbi:lysine transporter : Lysine exporter protein (LYSE/YGGA) OS=Acidovorax avenae (strain ATCC 19860 / DSM 7227 / JCM 20985 / NCPPB 1011) GN=Acav_2876 PE=4 SV=1: LysE [Gemmata massiliana]|uniref:Lysine transporter LysE n=1 Tax=Gemmata massiliana TaxID=1210884 RepID=A0A6P2DM48_9BACT|nr:LysE family translocator [Gemmata massiliana]VTS01837.1 lysine transporter : Lysine exporter protein (LYSE/YGGA) OS=Acidovorax avenae (strain ATCC 19860 / DSM 7227 / JCM 20985 / NCPPB 1011) GN=Acav_2876 PE=4 SV=1: LysE [Gemmata massiliana]
MPSTDLLMSFLLTSLVIAASPGPDNLAVLSTGMSRGRSAGIGFAIGCGLGCLTHTLWAVVGLSALVAASRTAFLVIQYAGATYLLYLGIKALRNAGSLKKVGHEEVSGANAPGSFWPYLGRGALSNALNPKVGLFFLAFLPLFMDTTKPVASQAALLGVLFTLVTVLLFVVLGYYAGAVGEWVKRRSGVGRWLDRATGCVFIGLAGHLAFSGRRP